LQDGVVADVGGSVGNYDFNVNLKDSKLGNQICSVCIYGNEVPGILFDEAGVCNYCHQVEELAGSWGTGQSKGEKAFESLLAEIKRKGRKKRYDCIIGVSGGTDSSYLMHLAVNVWGLRPLAFHYDNTWNTAIATQNVYKIVSGLGIDLQTHVLDNSEADDLLRSAFVAGIAELDGATDLGYALALRRAAKKYRVRFILEGHSFIEEGITPLGRNYFDGRYIREIHRKFGRVSKLRTYPLMTLSRFLYYSILVRPKFIRPYWFLRYSKDHAKKFLTEEFGWRYYGGHHLENRITQFLHSVYLPRKYGQDMRNNTIAAQVRQGLISQKEGLDLYAAPPAAEPRLEDYVRSRLGLSKEEYEEIMKGPQRNWQEFPTYKKTFEALKPLFYALAKAQIVTYSFYLKYCFPVEAKK